MVDRRRHTRRLPRSVRKHIRRAKSALRHSLPAAEAGKAIEQLVKRFRVD